MKNLRRLACTVSLLLFLASAALADPPSRAVRLKYLSGQVSVQPGGVDEWVAATVNRPLTTADRVWTDKDSRAELHLGTAAMRMSDETSLTLSNVNDSAVQVELHQGTLNLRIVQLFDGEIYEVDTPNIAFTVLKSGNYRFDVDATGDTTRVTVWKGEGEASGDGPGVRMRSREQAEFFSGRSLAHNLGAAPGRDGFDDWCLVRDEREDRSQSVRYVSRYTIGYEDLDHYGRWVVMPSYGPVWVPASVSPGWAPYRYGHWIWVEPWGWTWVDDAPWGFAPFHYGRWVYTRGYWGWCPGPLVVRPYYAPALVAWIGGSHWGVGVSFGSRGGYGWFPLGYGEPYIPYYRVSRGYFQNVNVTNTRITNITYVTNNYYNNSRNITRIHYNNNRVPGAVTAVPHDTLVNSRPVYRDAVLDRERKFKNVPVMAGPPVAPSRHSVLGERAGNPAAAPPRDVFRRPVVSRMPQPSRPVPFAERERELARDPGRPLDSRREEEIRRRGPQQAGDNGSDRPGVGARGRDVPRPSERSADLPVERGKREMPESAPRARDRSRDDVGAASERNRERVVPRPPERNADAREDAGRNDRPTPAVERADETRGARDRDSARPVPRPPERNAGAREGAGRNDRPTPAVERPDEARGARDRDVVRPVPRPPEDRGSNARPQREAEERPPARPQQSEDRPIARPPVERAQPNSAERVQRPVEVPRPQSRAPEVRREAPAVERESVSRRERPVVQPARQESRAPETRRESPPQREIAAPPPARPAEMPRQQQSRAPEMRREAPPAQRQAAPSRGNQSGGGKQESKPAQHDRGSKADRDSGKPQ